MLRQLSPDQEPNFGLMTPQHMVEHLVMTTKLFSRRKGDPVSNPPTPGAAGFRSFVDRGCPFEHRPKPDVTKADLPDLKFNNMDEAITELESAILAFYAFGDADPKYKGYNPRVGEYDMEELDLIIGRHAKWHAYQFGLVEDF